MSQSKTKEKILIIDDELLVLEMHADFFQSLGYEVLMANDEFTGLDIFKKESPGIVLLALNMQKLDGLEILAEFSRQNTEVPVIVISEMGKHEDVIKAIRLGAWDYLEKPISDLSFLKHSVQSALAHARLIRERKNYQTFLEEEVKRRNKELLNINAKLISAQKQLKEELTRAQKLEPIGILAGGIAHDFNNILSSVIYSTELVMMNTSEEAEEYSDLERIIKVCQRGKIRIKQIMSYIRSKEQRKQQVNLVDVLNQSLTLLGNVIPSTITIKKEISDSQCFTSGIFYQLVQVIINILTNAVHALEGRTDPFIKVKLSVKDESSPPNGHNLKSEYIIIEIEDNGCGIIKENAKKIFDPLFTTKSEKEGTGLGLSVVQEIIKRHQGSIKVFSKLNHGTTFKIYLPHDKTFCNVKEPKQNLEKKIHQGHGRTVLVVDDDKHLGHSLSKVLQNIGYNILLANDGEEGLTIFSENKNKINLVLADQDMPLLTGIEFSKKIYKLNPLVPVIIMTGEIHHEKNLFLGQPNIKDVLFKPINIVRIHKSIEKACVQQTSA